MTERHVSTLIEMIKVSLERESFNKGFHSISKFCRDPTATRLVDNKKITKESGYHHHMVFRFDVDGESNETQMPWAVMW